MNMIKQTVWRPDTCGCVLIIEWDSDAPAEDRQHRPVVHAIHSETHEVVESARTCEHHAKHGRDHVAHYEAVLAENQFKNRAVGALATTLGVEPQSVIWGYGPDRRLILGHRELTPDWHERIRAALPPGEVDLREA